MMTGQEHYREADRLMRLAQNGYKPEQTTAMAQVHATLALAAAADRAWAARPVEEA